MNPASPSPSPRGGIWIALQFGTIAIALVTGWIWRGHWNPEVSSVVGKSLLILSGIIAAAGFLALGRNLTPNPRPRETGTLVQHGIYRVMRHPLYTSLVLGCLGWSLQWQSGPALAATAFLAWALDSKARVEERWLHKRFADYASYAHRVRRFIPWVY